MFPAFSKLKMKDSRYCLKPCNIFVFPAHHLQISTRCDVGFKLTCYLTSSQILFDDISDEIIDKLVSKSPLAEFLFLFLSRKIIDKWSFPSIFQIEEGAVLNVAGGLIIEHPLVLPLVKEVVRFPLTICLHISRFSGYAIIEQSYMPCRIITINNIDHKYQFDMIFTLEDNFIHVIYNDWSW